ncbi:MAG: hypothetical protein AB7Q37_01985 [Pyrinomonadaceae bacterium]
MLSSASARARESGRAEVADYLDLRSSNDLIRRAGVKWIFDTMLELAAEANRSRLSVTIDRIDPHSFEHAGANIVGSRLEFRHGVRCLTVEAGWTRTPTDGFIRGGGLAIARLRHFGIPAAGTTLSLIKGGEVAEWRPIDGERVGGIVEMHHLGRHIDLLTDFQP